jgi:hypothetical protein
LGRTAHEAMKTRKPKIGGRYVAWMRGAFERAPVAAAKLSKVVSKSRDEERRPPAGIEVQIAREPKPCQA